MTRTELLEHLQGIDQPLDARVEAPPAIVVVAVFPLLLEIHFRIQVRVFTGRQFLVLARHRQRIGVQLALGKPCTAARVLRNSTRPVPWRSSSSRTRRERASSSPPSTLASNSSPSLPRKPWMALRAPAKIAVVEQFLHRFGDRAVLLALPAERFEVVEAVRIEQAQAREVAVLAELLRGRGEQQDAWNDLRQLLDQRVFGADLVLVPDQVVGFVDHQQGPSRRRTGASWARSSSFSHSRATRANWVSSKGLLASLSAKRSLSNRATCRLKRRRISTSHWCWRFSGTRISTRPARPRATGDG